MNLVELLLTIYSGDNSAGTSLGGNVTYGSITNPIDIGSIGSSSAAGGTKLKIIFLYFFNENLIV